MSQDEALRARVDGKARTQASVVWSLTVRSVSFRCLPRGSGFVVQARTDKGWTTEVVAGSNPANLLTTLVRSLAGKTTGDFQMKDSIPDRRRAIQGEIFLVSDPQLTRHLIDSDEPGCCEVHPKSDGKNGQWFCISCCVPLQHNMAKDTHCEGPAPRKSAIVNPSVEDGQTPAKHVLAWRSFDSGKIEVP